MALVGITLLVASVVFFGIRSLPWLSGLLASFQSASAPINAPPPTPPATSDPTNSIKPSGAANGRAARPPPPPQQQQQQNGTASKAELDRAAMPPPPLTRRPAPAPEPPGPPDEEQTTPKARAAPDADAVPSFSLSPDEPSPQPAATFAGPASAQRLMPPTLAGPSPTAARALPLPLPNRGGGARPPTSLGLSSSLAPPPTHSGRPARPSRKVELTPGHSPLDWARLSGGSGAAAAADLRGLPPATPYLRVPPSTLGRQTGRRGRDAWTALGGRVYNLTAYLPFHPGGEPELLRAAGRDGTRLFGEIHPWVNYETMLAACLIGVMVDEDEAAAGSKMEEMD